MFDLRQLDYLFASDSIKKDFDADRRVLRQQKKYTRLVKIAFPAIAAALIGLLAVLPTLQERTDFLSQAVKPKAQELEKMHIENTKIFITDKNNRVNRLNAKTVDETEPKSQVLKIVSPDARLLVADDKWVDIKAPTGFYDQGKKFVTLQDNVKIVYSEGMEAITKKVFYDANAGKIYGNNPIKAWGKYGKLSSQKFNYVTSAEVLSLFGKTDIDASKEMFGDDIKIAADETVKFYDKDQKLVAKGNALVVREGMTVKGDEITALFAEVEGKKKLKDFLAKNNVVVYSENGTAFGDKMKAVFNAENKIDRVELTGNVKTEFEGKIVYAEKAIYYPETNVIEMHGDVKTSIDNRQIRADKGFYYQEQQVIKMEGNIELVTEDAKVLAQKGTYDTKSGIAKMYEKVVILKDGNRMNSDYAETNLNTGVSKIGNGTKKRVSGVIYENSIKKNGSNKGK